MNSSEFSRITDELLSAYIDNAVTAQERKLVEAASAADAEIAWRLDSLRQTVNLLHGLPEIPLPRSFVLQESQVMEAAPPRRPASRAQSGSTSFLDRFSRGWRSFWQPGNPVLRNAAAAALVLLLVLAGGDALLGDLSFGRGLQAPAGGDLAMSEAAPIQFAEPAAEPEMAKAAPETAPVQVAAADTAEEAAAIIEEDAADNVADASAEDDAPALAEEPPAESETALAAQAAPQPQATPEAQPTARILDEPPAAAAAMAQPGPSGGELPPDVAAAEEAMIFGALGIGGEDGRGGAPGPRAAAPQEAPGAALELAPAPPAMPLPDESPAAEEETAAEETAADEAVEPFAAGEMTETISSAAATTAVEMPAPAAAAAATELPAQEEEAEEAAPPEETDAGEQEVEGSPAAVAKAADEHAALPIATATLLPTQTPSVAPAYSPLREPYPEPVARSVHIGFPGLLQWAQLGLALAVFILGVLWWRSR